MNRKVYNYVRERGKGNQAYMMKVHNKNYISFRDDLGHFTGMIRKGRDSVNATKKYVAKKVTLTTRVRGVRGKQRRTYLIYNRREQKELLWRMNRRIRTKTNLSEIKRRIPKIKMYRDDTIATSGRKKTIDLMNDKITWKKAKIVEVVSP